MQDYLINWNAGPLGVVLRPDLGLDMPPVVAQLLPQASVLRMSGVRVGDLLISVNGKKAAKLGYDRVVKLLFKERLPIVLHFRVPSGPGPVQYGADAAEASHASEPDYMFAQYQDHRGLPAPPPSHPSTPALPSERFTDASVRDRPRAGSSVLGVPVDFVDPPALVRVQSQPHRGSDRDRDRPPQHHRQQDPYRAPSQQDAPVMGRGRRSQSLESVTRPSRRPASAPSPRQDASPGREERRHKHKRTVPKDRAEAEERRLRKQYSVVWERGSLGLSFRAFNAKVDVPTVDFISTSRGQGRGMERVCVNDVLIAVNGEKTKLLGVEKVLRWLHVVDKPVVLRFHASSDRLPSNPVPQVANSPSLPPPLRSDAPQKPHPPTRRNTATEQGYREQGRNRRESADNAQPTRFEQRYEAAGQPQEEQHNYYDADNDDEFEQLYPQPDPPARSDRRHSTDGPRLPQRERDDSMYAYIARAHENRVSTSAGQMGDANGASHDSDGSVDALGDFRREQQPMEHHPERQRPEQPTEHHHERQQRLDRPVSPPGLHEFDLRIDAHVVPRETAARRDTGAGRGRVASTDSSGHASGPARRRSHSSGRSNQRKNHVVFDDAPLTAADMHVPPKQTQMQTPPPPPSPQQQEQLVQQQQQSVPPPPPGSPSIHSSRMNIGWGMERVQESAPGNVGWGVESGLDSSQDSTAMNVGWSMNPEQQAQQSPATLQRKASLTASELTLRAAIEVVARAMGRPAEKCEFAGVPLVRIQDGSVQAKLLVVYARTCLAKDQAAKAAGVPAHPQTQAKSAPVEVGEPVPSTVQLPPVAGNPLGRKGSHRQFLSYTITTDGETAAYTSTQKEQEHKQQHQEQQQEQQQEQRQQEEEASAEHRPQYVPQYSDGFEAPHGIPVTGRASRLPTGDFIALDDFELQHDGSLAERRPGSSVHSSSTGKAAANGADDSASRSSTDSSGHRATHSVASAGPLVNGVNHLDEKPSHTPEPTALSVGSSTAEVLSSSDTSLHPDVTTFDDLIALPMGRQTPVEHSDELLDDDELEAQEEREDHEEHHEDEKEEEHGPSAMEDPRVASLFAATPDVHKLLTGKRPSTVLTKKGMIDEIQEILDSLQMETQFERHSYVGMGTMPSPPTSGPLVDVAAQASVVTRSCCHCGKHSDDLADMSLGGRDWYCQDCWEFFFYNEERERVLEMEQEPSPSLRTRSRSLSGERGSELDTSSVDDEEAFKYSFHDSAFGRDDVLMMRLVRPSPSRSPLSPGSSPRDSALTSASSITENGDEVWL